MLVEVRFPLTWVLASTTFQHMSFVLCVSLYCHTWLEVFFSVWEGCLTQICVLYKNFDIHCHLSILYSKEIEMHQAWKSLYHFGQESGLKLYSEDNCLVGTTTGYVARPNGQANSIGSIEIQNSSGEKFWLKGFGVNIFGIGIKIMQRCSLTL